jgi:2-(1,2-epoxy-1,2-dihydrophenyl)acetyl-CoA isomerase
MEPVATLLEQGVLRITLNRPQVLNALDVDTHVALREALTSAEDSGVRAVILTGAGRGFCVGQDLAEFQALEWDAGEHLRRFYNPIILALRALAKPVMAAVNGVTAGAGIGLACACDLRVASDTASFTPAFESVALVPDSGTSFFVPRLIGRAQAFVWLTTGRTLDAEEARVKGLVDEVVAAADLEARTAELAAAYAARAGNATGMTKRLLDRADDALLAEHLEVEAQLQRDAADSAEHKQAIAAFLARRSAKA